MDDLINRMYCNLSDGKKISMPRYYKDKLYTKLHRQAINMIQSGRMADKLREDVKKKGSKEYYTMQLNHKISEQDRKKFQNLQKHGVL